MIFLSNAYWLLVIIIGILGLIIGSFLNVVILRMNTGKGIGGRSQCLSCNTSLHWYELLPVISFIIQRGKCRTCKTRISWQYPLVEMSTAVLFMGVTLKYSLFEHPVTVLLWLLLVSLGVVIAVYDIRHYVIPLQPLVVFFAVTAALGLQGWAALVVPFPFFILWIISRGAWIGFGDIELMACAGILLGLTGGLSAVVLAFWVACIVIIPWYVMRKIQHRSVNHVIAFGPFILVGMYSVAIGGINLLTIVQGMVL